MSSWRCVWERWCDEYERQERGLLLGCTITCGILRPTGLDMCFISGCHEFPTLIRSLRNVREENYLLIISRSTYLKAPVWMIHSRDTTKFCQLKGSDPLICDRTHRTVLSLADCTVQITRFSSAAMASRLLLDALLEDRPR